MAFRVESPNNSQLLNHSLPESLSFTRRLPVAVGAVLVRVGAGGDADGAALAGVLLQLDGAPVAGAVAGGGRGRGRGEGGGGAGRRSFKASCSEKYTL